MNTEQDTGTAERPQGKTLKQIADELGIDKSTVFRYCKSASLQPIGATLQRNGAMLYDATAETAIKAHFEESRPRTAMARQNRRNIARNSAESGSATAATLQNAMLQHPTEAAADTVGQLRQQLEDVTADRDKLAAERDALRDQLEGLRRDLTESRAKLEALTEERDRLRGELDRAAATVDQLRQDHRQQLDDLREDHRAELDRLTLDRDNLKEEHRQQLEALRAELTEERQHSRETAERLAQLADQAQRLQLAQMQPPAQIPERKPSLWARLFGKHKHDFDIEGGQDHSPN